MDSLILLSGGLDSAVLLASIFNSEHRPLYCVGFDYGQRHEKELWSGFQLAHFYGSIWERVNLPRSLFAGSALTGHGDVPHAHYRDPAQSATVVPNRNIIFLSMAGTIAVRHGLKRILFAAHAGDAAIYPDCREEFLEPMARAIAGGTYARIALLRPFVATDKAGIVRRGHELDVDFSHTWSCYKGGDLHCGTCGTCVERREAFLLAGVPDPTLYANEGPLPAKPNKEVQKGIWNSGTQEEKF